MLEKDLGTVIVGLERELPDSVRARIDGMDRRSNLIVLATEALQLYEELARQAGLSATRNGLITVADAIEEGAAILERQERVPPSRRRFFKVAGLYLLAVACAAPLNPGIKMEVNHDLVKPMVNLGEFLEKPSTKVLNRKFPKDHYVQNVGRADFDGHKNSPYYRDMAGFDLDPNPGAQVTYVGPAASGVVYGLWNLGASGIRIVIFHGNGYITTLAHLAERDNLYLGQRVHRGTKIGKMGTDSKGILHTHSTLWGPAFDPYIIGTKTQYHPTDETVSPYVKDHEEFSILGKGKPLPHPVKEDFQLDEKFNADLIATRKDVDLYLRDFPHNNSVHPQKVLDLQQRIGIDLTLDRDIFYLMYTVLSKLARSYSNELVTIKTRLAERMLVAPRFTSFVVA